MRLVVSRRAPRELPAQGPGGGTRNPGRLWAVCIPGAGPATRAAELRDRRRGSGRPGSASGDGGRRGRVPLGSAGGGDAPVSTTRPLLLSCAQARPPGSERKAPTRSAFSPAASCERPWSPRPDAHTAATGDSSGRLRGRLAGPD